MKTMNNAKQVDELIASLKSGGVPFSEAVWQKALACVGWPYVFGAWGAECTVTERKKRYNAHPKYTSIKTACKAFDGGTCNGCKWFPEKERVRCYDCRGFTDWCLKQFGFDLAGEGATSQWDNKKNWKEKGLVVEGVPQGVIVCLFYRSKDDPSKMAHTGLYYNGETCECSTNVQHATKINKKWTHWAVPAFEGVVIPDPVTPAFTPLKKGNKGDRVKELQERLIALGYSLPKYGADGSFGNETLSAVKQFQNDNGLPANGTVDEATWNMLNNAPKRKLYTVTIENLPAEKADEIIQKYGGSKKMEE